jgi:hypothetical protein
MPPRLPDWYKQFLITTMLYAVFLPALYHREKASERAIRNAVGTIDKVDKSVDNKNTKGKAY